MTVGYQPFLIANPRVGMERDIEPWLLPQDGFPDLQDCYLFRGRVKRRLSFSFLGRLNKKIGTTDAGGNFVFNFPVTLVNFPLPMSPAVSTFVVGATTYHDPEINGAINPVVLLTNGPGVGTLDRATGVLTIAGGPDLTDVFYFPGLPVMGLSTFETTDINIENLVGFDTRFAYSYDSVAKKFNDFSLYHGTVNEFNWTGTDSDLFWTTNYSGAFWATNNVPGFQTMETTTTAAQGDGLRWADLDNSGWINFLPPINDPVLPADQEYLLGALMLIPYQGALIALNTWEGKNLTPGNFNRFQQRARWSGPLFTTPFYATVPNDFQGGSNPDAWKSDVAGNGDFIDAPTNEVIVSCELLKNTLIVYFERSTWQLVFTGISSAPFLWQKINTELGAESTFSIVPFDKTVLAIGDVGIHACDTVNVERIDQKIPDEVFSIQNANKGPERTYGIRDYFNQLVYWSFPYIGTGEPANSTLIYPNRILVYNYVDQSFSYFNDSFTCFGYYQSSDNLLWQNATMTWEEASFPWVSPINQAEFPNVVGGNQHGFVEILMQDTVNDESLFISNITIGVSDITLVVPNHNFVETTTTNPAPPYIKIVKATGTVGLTGVIYKIVNVPDENTIVIDKPPGVAGVFTGDGLIAPVNNINILTKRFNPWIQEGGQARLGYADFYFKKTDNGEVTINLFIDEDTSLPLPNSPVVATFPESTYVNSPDRTPYIQDKLWKRAYFQDIQQLFQLQITMNEDQMTNFDISSSDIVLHGLILWSAKSGRLINV